MQHLGIVGPFIQLALNLWGFALLAGFILRHRWLAVSVAPLAAVTVFFCVETFVGLGNLRAVGFCGTLASCALIWMSVTAWLPSHFIRFSAALEHWREEFYPKRLAGCGVVFLLVFTYAFGWRFAFPDIDGSSEKIADLAYIASYLPGGRIPVVDAWLDPYPSVQYYSFQHYGAALMGRLLGLDAGLTYNLAFCVLVALIATAFAGAVMIQVSTRLARFVLVLTFVLGGTGATLLVHLTDKEVRPWSAMRYIGSTPYDQEPVGPLLRAHAERFEKLDMPAEPFAYSIYLGDYHAPLASYYLLSVAVTAAVMWHRTARRRYAAIVGATVTWTLLSNTWALPLHGLAVSAWCLANVRRIRELLPAVIIGGGLVALASWGYLSHFTAAAAGYKTSIKAVAWAQHTPPLLFMLFHLPTIGMALLAVVTRHRASRVVGVVALSFLLLTELIFVDDIYSGAFERFNTTLKWWPLVSAGVLLVGGAQVLNTSRIRWVRVAAYALCFYSTTYAFDLARIWVTTSKPSLGKLDGVQFLKNQVESRLLLERLRLEPHGLAIERPTREAFSNSACLPLFAGHRMFLGWLGHEQLWRGYRDDLPQRQDRLFQFFDTTLADPLEFAAGQGVDYVLWYQPEDSAERWETLHRALSPEYRWCEVYLTPEGRRVGFWKQLAPVR